jgi:DNA-binding LacI/PurR family transcriptional regulator
MLIQKGRGGVLHIQGPSENAAAKDRTAGMHMTLPSSVAVTTLRGQWTEESAQRSVESWLKLNTSHKIQISAIGAQNDVMAMGARKAFKSMDNVAERDRWLRLPYTVAMECQKRVRRACARVHWRQPWWCRRARAVR